MNSNNEIDLHLIEQDPMEMIRLFANRHSLYPEMVSDIFVAGAIQLREDGRLPEDAIPWVQWRKK